MAKARAGLDFEEGRWLLAALRSRVHVRLGFGSFAEYVERLFGYVPRLTQEKLRIAESLEQLPEAASALQNGQTCWSALRELTRVAGEPIEVGREIAVMAACDIQHIAHVGVDGRVAPQRASQDVPPATRRWVLRRDGGCCVFPGESDVRRALAEAAHVGAIDDVEALVRRCLVLLTERFAKAG